MDKELIKRRLRQEQQQWEAEQLAAGCTDPTLQIWSIGRLLRSIDASQDDADPQQTLMQCGIVRSEVAGLQVTYTASSLWITGFLRFRDDAVEENVLQLCDAGTEMPSFLLDPSPHLVDQLVLVKNWVLVDKSFGGPRTKASMFLEVHDRKPAMLLPCSDPYADWTREQVQELLEKHYPTVDTPMYTGGQPWTMVAHPNGTNGSSPLNARLRSVAPSPTGKQRKRKRVYAVLGCISSVSPISWQKDRESSHFFVEVEQSSSDSRAKNVVSIMFAGVAGVRWHLFLRPGSIVLISDLVKVYSRECEMFLLQTTNGYVLDSSMDSLKTTVISWEAQLPTVNIGRCIEGSMHSYSAKIAKQFCGKLVDYQGRVGNLLWDECIELHGADGTRVLLCLFRFPYAQELVRLRKNTTVQVYNAHVLRWPTPIGGKLVIGLCPRSHLSIVAFSESVHPCVVEGVKARHSRSRRKWLEFGNFYRQSMALSMWQLELLEQLATKFIFATDSAVSAKDSILSFPGLRRRQAVVRVVEAVGQFLDTSYKPEVETLGAMFLKCHSQGASGCATAQMSPEANCVMGCRPVTISELQRFGKLKLEQMAELSSGHTLEESLSVQISSTDLDWCLLVGCIQGSVHCGNLEICDRTGSIPLRFETSGNDGAFMAPHGDCGVYLLRNFDLYVEDFNQLGGLQDEKLPITFCISCLPRNASFVSLANDGDDTKASATSDTRETLEILVQITDVNAVPVSNVRASEGQNEYSVLHAVVLQVGEGLLPNQFLSAAHHAEIVVDTRCVTSNVSKYGFYRMKVTMESETSRSFPAHSKEDTLKAATNYFTSVPQAQSSVVCIDALERYLQAGGKIKAQQPPQYRLYRVDSRHQHPIIPLKLDCSRFSEARCKAHANCNQIYESRCGLFAFTALEKSFRDEAVGTKPTTIRLSSAETVGINVLQYFLLKAVEAVHIGDLLFHPLQERDSSTGDRADCVMRVNPDLQQPHFMSVVGLVVKKQYHWKLSKSKQSTTIGVKRIREGEATSTRIPSRRLACIVHLRDLRRPDTVEVKVDASQFGLLGGLQVNKIVEIARLRGVVARSSYKVYLNWCEYTALRSAGGETQSLAPPDCALYGSMATTFLNGLYTSSCVDRRLHRYVVQAVHVNYVVLKRRCRACHQALQLDRRQGCWKHPDAQAFYRECAWRQHVFPSDPDFKSRTRLSTTVRCIIDDGSGQAELFMEDEVAWELLSCTDKQRRRFEEIVSLYVDELSYFSGNAGGSFATSKAEREREYYQNELRAFVFATLPSLRALDIVARRFYNASDKDGTSVLTFGKDIQIQTKTAATPKLEAKRVDRLHVRSELQKRLATLRASSKYFCAQPVD